MVSATCDDISRLIEERKFRIDFYFRLKGIELTIPPLKERKRDIQFLIEHFQRKSPRKVVFSKGAMETLSNYDWFGNVRELENFVKEVTSSTFGEITSEQLPTHIQKNRNPYKPQENQRVYTKGMSGFIMKHGLRRFIEVVEQEAYREAYEKNDGNISKTQQQLGISKSACYRIQDAVRSQSQES